MTSNDGQRMTVLGLTFRQHHTLHMQQVLRAYQRLPANPMDRVALYTGLFELAKGLSADETQNIENWLKHGGPFPAPPPKNQPFAQGNPIDLTSDSTDNGDGDQEELWQEYHPEDFEGAGPENKEEDDDDEVLSEDHEGESDHESEEEESEEERPVQRRRPQATLTTALSARQRHKSTAECVECTICAESYTSMEFPSSTQITSTCTHESEVRVCNYCLQQSIATAVEEGQLHLIICPVCPSKLSHNEIKKFATKEVFARFEYLTMMATPDLVMCMGPNCDSGQIHVGDDPVMICEVCSFKTCAKHKWPWHEGQTCDQFDVDEKQIERLEEAEATAKLLAKEHAQICPNCQNVVSRIDGCDHMTCRCGNEWCYVCGVSYEKIKQLGQEAHASTCTYHPRRVQVRKGQEQAVQGQFTQLVHGGPVSESLERARGERNARIRAEMRPLAAQAAERRMKEMEQQTKENLHREKKRKRNLNMHQPWEEH